MDDLRLMRNDFPREVSALFDDYLSKAWAENHGKASDGIVGLIGHLHRIVRTGFRNGGERPVDAHQADCRSSSVPEAVGRPQAEATHVEDADLPITVDD